MLENPKKLKGQELASYVEENREKFNGNGDKLCLAAGYGITREDGSTKCNLPSFINELDKLAKIKKRFITPES